MRKVLAGTLLVVAFTVAGCGRGSPSSSGNDEASKSGRQVLADAVKAAKAASSLHISWPGSGGIDLTIVKGRGGTLADTHQKEDIVVIGDHTYVKGYALFWYGSGLVRGPPAAHTLGGRWRKWVKVPTSKSPCVEVIGCAGYLTNTPSLLDELLSMSGKVTNEGARTYKGRSVVAIVDDKGRILYVANSGTPYPVARAGSGVHMTFDSWNKPVTLTAPAGAIAFSKLSGR